MAACRSNDNNVQNLIIINFGNIDLQIVHRKLVNI